MGLELQSLGLERDRGRSLNEPEMLRLGAGAVTASHLILSFQVGLVSWGLYNPCGNSNKNSRQKAPKGKIPPPRDFHINLFRLQPWLRQHLEGILNFLPL